MGSLNNLYISQSYQGLLTFSTNSGSTSTLTQISDGTGQGLGLYLNNSGSASLNADMYIGGDLTVSGTFDIEGAVVIRDNVFVTGSIYSSADISSSRMLAGEMTASNMTIAGTLNVFKINTTIESSSVIFSSGSNILGDSILDTQTLNGTIIMSGSSQLTGSMGITGDISSSTLSGIGNVTNYSASVQTKFNSVNNATASLFTSASLGLVTASVNINVLTFKKGNGDQFTLTVAPISFDSGAYATTASFNAYTSSTNLRLTNLESTTASLNISVSNLNQYTQSNDTKWNTLQIVTQSLNAYTASQNNLNVTFATTGSNTFIGNQTITGSLTVTGSMVYSGSVRGQVFPITIASNTASMDCSKGNFFTVSLPAGATRLEATNIQPGETLSLRITNSTSGSQLTGSAAVKFPTGFTYVPTNISASTDIITFLSFDNSAIYAVAANYFA
jgi:hypothetical protein